MTPSRSAFGASPPGGRSQWPGKAGSTAAAWRAAGLAFCLLVGLALLWLAFGLATVGQALMALGVLAFGGAALWIYGFGRSLAWKYLFPGVAGMLLFVAFPLLYTVQMGFTNYSSNNLLEQERARQYLLDQTVVDEAQSWPFTLHADGTALRIRLLAPMGAEATGSANAVATSTTVTASAGSATATGTVTTAGPPAPALISPPLPAAGAAGPALLMQPQGSEVLGPALPLREVVARREQLLPLQLQWPAAAGGGVLRYAGLREFGVIEPLWAAAPDGAVLQRASGQVFKPNPATGFFESAKGSEPNAEVQRMQPGFKVSVGLAHYSRMLLDADFRGPFVSIFIWTVCFAAFTVLFAGSLGLVLAVLLNWEGFKGRTLYRTLLFLPYAVPGFISILVFKGLFNQNFGEINAILDSLVGIRPAWFADPLLAKVMILIVNTWLGYPYFMILCTGLIKAIPADLYEASAIAGAGPWVNFFKITLPLIVKPLTPLLISAFAFNFNNFVLISLLTDGRPDFLNTKLPAGTNDILVSYTYRIAFTDSGQNFGLAAAISTLIFVMVAAMGLLQLKLTQRAEAGRNEHPPAGAAH
jgi:maltose/maltodextrin transport system permease protein